ncbi:MAG: hypothetical protein ACYDBX_04195 [Patescibacteria group bacterium]
MNFLNNDSLSKNTSFEDSHYIKKIDKIVKKRLRIYIYVVVSLFVISSLFIFKSPLNVFANIEGKVFLSKQVMAANVYLIRNKSLSNLDKLAGVNIINPNIEHARMLAAVIPSKNNEISSSITTTSNANVQILYNFLVSHGSPMAPYAGEFISAGLKYGVSWKLLVAISGVESGFGRVIPESVNGALSYNGWGWTGGGSEFSGFSGFGSWPNAINSIAAGIGSSYRNESPYQMQPVYDPPNPTWAPKVQSYINQL